MKLTEYKGEEAIEVLADILVPSVEIFSDKEVVKSLRSENPLVVTVSKVVKGHTKEVLEILAAMEHTPVEEYECPIPDIINKVMEIVNDDELKAFFTSLASTGSVKSSGDATESTEEVESISSNT